MPEGSKYNTHSQGEISAAPAPSMRDAIAWWLADMWFGNDREGMQKAHKATNWLETAVPPVGMATAMDDIRDPAMRGEYAQAALAAAMAFPPVKALHITPRNFRRFDMNKVLGGASGTGVQNQGVGHYFMEPTNPSESMYGDIFTTSVPYEKATGVQADSSSIYRDILDFIDKELPMYNDRERFSEIPDRALNRVLYPHEPPMEGFLPRKLEDYVTSKYDTKIEYPNRFDVNLHVGDPLQLPQYYEPIDKQPDNVRSLMQMLAEDAYNPDEMWINMLEKTRYQPPQRHGGGVTLAPNANATEGGYQAHLMWPTGAYVSDFDYHPTKGQAENAAMAELDKLLGLREKMPVALVSQYRGKGLKNIYDKYGLPGHRYFDPESGGYNEDIGQVVSAGNYHNYVITDDNKIEIVKKSKYKPKESMLEKTFPDLFGPEIDLFGDE